MRRTGGGPAPTRPLAKRAAQAARTARTASPQPVRGGPVAQPKINLAAPKKQVYSQRRQRIEHLIDSATYGWMHPVKIAAEYKRMNLSSAEKRLIERESAKRGERAQKKVSADYRHGLRQIADVPGELAVGTPTTKIPGTALRHFGVKTPLPYQKQERMTATDYAHYKRTGHLTPHMRQLGAGDQGIVFGMGEGAVGKVASRLGRGGVSRLAKAGERLVSEERGALNPLGGVGEEVPKPSLKEVPKPPEQKVAEKLPAARTQRRLTEKGYSAERGRRIGSHMEVFEEAGRGKAGADAVRAQLHGPLPKRRLRPTNLTPDQHDELVNKIFDHPHLKGFEKVRTEVALDKLVRGDVPQRNEIALLKRVFSGDQMTVVRDAVTPQTKAGKVIQQIWNLPRVTAASLDVSFPLRQGLSTFTHSPEIGVKGIAEGLRAVMPSELRIAPERFGGKTIRNRLVPEGSTGRAYVDQMHEQMLKDPAFDRSLRAGVNYTDVPGAISPREDPMMYGHLAEKYLPGVGASSRSFSASGNVERYLLWKKLTRLAEAEPGTGPLAKYLDKLSAGGASKVADRLTGRGYIAKAEEKGVKAKGHPWKKGPLGKTEEFDRDQFDRELAKLVNNLTGRGHTPFGLPDLELATKALNHVMFSPRLMYSRFNMMNPVAYTAANPFVRRQMIRSMTGMILGVIAVGQGLETASGGKVGFSFDPRSADFMKVKMGRTRLDLLAGFQQPVVLMAKLITGQAINSQTGELSHLGHGFSDTSRWDILDRFRRGKMHPSAALIEDAFRGTDYAYKPFSWKKAMLNSMIPLLWQDTYDVNRDYGAPAAAPLGILGALGVGMQSYGDAPASTGSSGVDPSGPPPVISAGGGIGPPPVIP